MKTGDKVKLIAYHALMQSISTFRLRMTDSEQVNDIENKWFAPIQRDYMNIHGEVFTVEQMKQHSILGRCWVLIGSKGKICLPEAWIE